MIEPEEYSPLQEEENPSSVWNSFPNVPEFTEMPPADEELILD